MLRAEVATMGVAVAMMAMVSASVSVDSAASVEVASGSWAASVVEASVEATLQKKRVDQLSVPRSSFSQAQSTHVSSSSEVSSGSSAVAVSVGAPLKETRKTKEGGEGISKRLFFDSEEERYSRLRFNSSLFGDFDSRFCLGCFETDREEGKRGGKRNGSASVASRERKKESTLTSRPIQSPRERQRRLFRSRLE
ncbi:hypothetical protein BDY24DRAFT_380119 [Mrakia frigida]|uniref:uncharacterized protein n=1 Tax=Mrakia frigida TaxID=29902 RepID=UPI003FCC0BCD